MHRPDTPSSGNVSFEITTHCALLPNDEKGWIEGSRNIDGTET